MAQPPDLHRWTRYAPERMPLAFPAQQNVSLLNLSQYLYLMEATSLGY